MKLSHALSMNSLRSGGGWNVKLKSEVIFATTGNATTRCNVCGFLIDAHKTRMINE